MPGYKHPCPFCTKFIESSVVACPFCGVTDPFTQGRCPDCRAALEPGWVACPDCGRSITAADPGGAAGPGTPVASRPPVPGTLATSTATAGPAATPAAVPASSVGATRCTGCGAALPPGARFCTECGTLVD